MLVRKYFVVDVTLQDGREIVITVDPEELLVVTISRVPSFAAEVVELLALSSKKDAEDWSSEDQQTMKNQEKFSVFDARFPDPKKIAKKLQF